MRSKRGLRQPDSQLLSLLVQNCAQRSSPNLFLLRNSSRVKTPGTLFPFSAASYTRKSSWPAQGSGATLQEQLKVVLCLAAGGFKPKVLM